MYGTYTRLRVTTRASDMTVIRAARTKLQDKAKRDPAMRAQRKQFYRVMLDYHHKARALVRQFAL